ncbi:heme-binding protein [Methylococcus sp. EFPC2]|uniref:heme-binding protein n=1 Tax=Methylococcus sp. EFPC2 TaxID=2812648 RepID=UPI0019678D98|nr:heme-binding protein [Methylococcus sp. EFPC2]QSA96941.1 heme-binding protein [Methylococcus sp. EFPC2]
MKLRNTISLFISTLALAFGAQTVSADAGGATNNTGISRDQLVAAVNQATTDDLDGGYPLKFWVTLVDNTGKVIEVVTNGATGENASNSEWLGSRVISAQKANTANAFSLNGYVISTANLYKATQPGGSLFGLQHSNPVDASTAYAGNPKKYGTAEDPLKGRRIGGVNVFGGGLALYAGGTKVGAIGVSGDTSVADHAFAWRVREALGKHPAAGTVGITTFNVDVAGVAQTPIAGAAKGDELILESGSADYWNAWSHPAAPNTKVGTNVGILQAP